MVSSSSNKHCSRDEKKSLLSPGSSSGAALNRKYTSDFKIEIQ